MATRITANTTTAQKRIGQTDLQTQQALSAIDAIAAEIAEVDTGLGIIDAATTNQVRTIVKGLLQSHRKTLVRQRAIIRKLME